jgi:N-acetylneuraminic acid mutarotase
MALTAFENDLYVIGGRDRSGITNIVEKYAPETDTWSMLASKIVPTTDIGAASLAGGIFVPGGLTADGKTTDLLEMYDPRQNIWIQRASLPIKISAYALVAFEGHLYIFGGWDGTQYTNSVYMYSPDQDEWQEQTPMPTARGYASAAVAGGKIYVFGGKNSSQILDINEVYQPDLDSGLTLPWSTAAPLPFGRAKMGIANIADIIYLLGGEGPNQDIVVLAYDPRDETWGQIEAPLPVNWNSLGSYPIGTRLFALGGRTEEGLVNGMWGFQALFTISLPIIR